MEGLKTYLGNWFSAVEADEHIKEVEVESAVDAIEETDDSLDICKFYLENKCRFGDQCRNKHEGNPAEKIFQIGKTKAKPDDAKTERSEKKPPMKTADDVIKRLQWDPMLPQEYFVIGYIDRFLGVVEENFTTFSWENLASVDYDVLVIPQHRIQYFKYKTEKVWDKTQRLDIVFSSTGSKVGIMQFMEEVDRTVKE